MGFKAGSQTQAFLALKSTGLIALTCLLDEVPFVSISTALTCSLSSGSMQRERSPGQGGRRTLAVWHQARLRPLWSGLVLSRNIRLGGAGVGGMGRWAGVLFGALRHAGSSAPRDLGGAGWEAGGLRCIFKVQAGRREGCSAVPDSPLPRHRPARRLRGRLLQGAS